MAVEDREKTGARQEEEDPSIGHLSSDRLTDSFRKWASYDDIRVYDPVFLDLVFFLVPAGVTPRRSQSASEMPRLETLARSMRRGNI